MAKRNHGRGHLGTPHRGALHRALDRLQQFNGIEWLRDHAVGLGLGSFGQGVGMRGVLTHEFRQEEPDGDVRPDAVIERLPDLPAVIERLAAA